MSNTNEPVFEVTDLQKHYKLTSGFLNTESGVAKAVDGISFSIQPGETIGIVGESGCGKSTAATTMLQLEEPTAGSIKFNGEEITEFNTNELRGLRREMQMVFQDPETSFNPRMSIGESVGEPLRVQGLTNKHKRKEIIGDLLERVGLSRSDMNRYPHEFSGGQKQRIALARALSVNPKLLVADEPVSALDVSIQSEILRLIDEFQEETGLAVIIISHNLGVVKEVCDRVAVMYMGEFVEVAPTEELFEDPQHPYTQSLLASIPTPDPSERGADVELTGDVPDPANPPSGCRFHPRCPKIIPPEGIEVPQETWRHVMNFRSQVETDKIDLDGITKLYTEEDDGNSQVTAEDVTAENLSSWVREHFEIPETISDRDLEETVTTAIQAVIDGETEKACNVLQDNTATVCEQESPETHTVGDNHTSACHLHDPDHS